MPRPRPLTPQVAPQPLWFSDTVANERKLAELPFHLLRAGRTQELLRDVLGERHPPPRPAECTRARWSRWR